MTLLRGTVFSILACVLATFFMTEIFHDQRKQFYVFLHKVSNILSEPCAFSVKKSNVDNTGDNQPYNILGGDGDMIFTNQELARYNGQDDSPGLYLSILGRVYDVADGVKFYGEGGGYSFFTAIDGTRAYMTGEFNEEGLIEDVAGLTLPQMIELEDWIKFYDKTYTYKGKLIGHFYAKDGKPTQALHDAFNEIKKAHDEKRKAQEKKQKMPPCNNHQKDGKRRVWCTNKSGGVTRDWEGLPRALYESGNTVPTCVCVRGEDLQNPHLKLFPGCDPTATSCSFLASELQN